VQRNSWLSVLLAFLITFLATGIPYWQIPYSKLSVPDSLPGYSIAIAVVLSALLRLVFDVPFLWAFVFVGLAFPACVMARVEVETLSDPTSHNLWPFEVLIAAGVGFSASLAGSVLGGLAALLAKKR
jgi:hypothetical protein